MRKKIKSTLLVVLAITMILSTETILSKKSALAVSKPVIAKSATVVKGRTKDIAIKQNGAMITSIKIKTSDWAVAKAKNYNNSIRITGVGVGKATITTTIKATINKKRKTFTYKTKVTVKPVSYDKVSINTFADLKKTLDTMQSAGGGILNLNSTDAGEFTIDGGKYNKVDLVVNTPSAYVTNKANFKSITIEAVSKDNSTYEPKDGWTEAVSGNSFTLNSTNPIVFVINKGITVPSMTFLGEVSSAVQNVKVLGTLSAAYAKNIAPVELIVQAESSSLGLVDISKNGAKVAIEAGLGSTVSKIHATQPCNIDLTGNSTSIITVEKIEGAIVNKADTLTGVQIKYI